MVSCVETDNPIEMPLDVVYWCLCSLVCMSTCLLGITTRPAEMAKSMEMPFRLYAMEPGIRQGLDFPRELAIFVGNVLTVH